MTGKAEQIDDLAHEFLDRAFILSSRFDAHILQRWYVVGNVELAVQAEKIPDALGELYQEIGK